eukprot:Hpha_TRINITY_DN18941_c0_g1::TRINITY_DN18941_c0_g1_i1::g.17496::m.17496
MVPSPCMVVRPPPPPPPPPPMDGMRMPQGYEQSVGALLAAGPSAVAHSPDLIFDVLVNLAAQQDDAKAQLCSLSSGRQTTPAAFPQVDMAVSGIQQRLDLLFAEVEGLKDRVARCEARPQHTIVQTPQPVESASAALGQRVAQMESRQEGLARSIDILSERVDISGEVTEAMRRMEVEKTPPDTVVKLSCEVDAHQAAIHALAREMFTLRTRCDELFRVPGAAEEQIGRLAQVVVGVQESHHELVASVRDVRSEASGYSSALAVLSERVSSAEQSHEAVAAAAEAAGRGLQAVEARSLSGLSRVNDQIQQLQARQDEAERRTGLCSAEVEELTNRQLLLEAIAKEAREDAVGVRALLDVSSEDLRWAVAGSASDRVCVLHAAPAFAAVLGAVHCLEQVTGVALGPTGDPRAQSLAPGPLAPVSPVHPQFSPQRQTDRGTPPASIGVTPRRRLQSGGSQPWR